MGIKNLTGAGHGSIRYYSLMSFLIMHFFYDLDKVLSIQDAMGHEKNTIWAV
ncbi:MAG: hypothetical protein LBT13_10315 [Treponema sp.]|nr:hypothetical protein [Treponema sp.]